ncbi:MAG: hypothetical protein JJ979_25565 [Roseibium sp.]|nr:hypothetical protein [Roseibium sp.]
MISLTNDLNEHDGRPININPSFIVALFPTVVANLEPTGTTIVTAPGLTYQVKEDYAKVNRMLSSAM